MRHSSRFGFVILLLLPAYGWAVYAPIPEQEQGKALTVTLQAGVSHDSNIFGAATNTVDSMVYTLAPKLTLNTSVAPQTFVSAWYQATFDYFDNRPTDKLLISHEVSARLAHAFTPVTTIDLSDGFMVDKNPRSLLAGMPLNTDQSYQHNEFDARLMTAPGEAAGMVLKYRNILYQYDDAGLARNLDRMEHLAGIEATYKFLPEATLVGEYRYQKIGYDQVGAFTDKQSHFLLAGGDYSPGKHLAVSARAGAEDRTREGDRNTTAPYAEFTCKYTYTEQSFVSAGYTYSLEETNDPIRFTDTKMHRLLLNVQHALTARIIASGSITVEPAELQGRAGVAAVEETGTRLGAALTYVIGRNFTVSATWDYDKVDSDAAYRCQERTRLGVHGRLYF
jgi:predicted porin